MGLVCKAWPGPRVSGGGRQLAVIVGMMGQPLVLNKGCTFIMGQCRERVVQYIHP